jgi:sulfur relay (sulfurtransferase) DsrF/TusC family protein
LNTGTFFDNHYKSKIYGNQNLFQQEESLQERRLIQRERVIQVQNEKALYLQCHMVVLAVKII